MRQSVSLLEIFFEPQNDRKWRRALSKQKHYNAKLLEIGKKACLNVQTQKQRDAIGVLRRVRDDLKRVEAINARLAATKHRSVAFRRG